MNRFKQSFVTLIGVPIAALCFSGAGLAADAGMLKMRFTQSGNTSSSWPLYVAEQKKMFEKNGLQVEVIIIRGATNVVRAVLSETIPIGRINPDYVIGASEKGAKVKIVAANMEKIPYDIYARAGNQKRRRTERQNARREHLDRRHNFDGPRGFGKSLQAQR